VASFIGRTNLMQGKCNGETVGFDHFDLPRGLFQDGIRSGETVLFSVRPQSIGLHRARPPADGICVVAGELVERAFLGESWDYVVSPVGADLRLKISALPHQVFEVGAKVWMQFDPRQMAAIEG
jgi:iron(III) transport system ATP-binding protein